MEIRHNLNDAMSEETRKKKSCAAGAAMKVDIRDAGTVSVLRPLEIASYLRASAWKQTDVKEGQYAVWTLDDDVEAFLPLRTDTSDYALRMGDLLRVLSAVEDRSQTELLADLLTTNADVVRVRLIDDDFADGSMPIEDYTRTSQKARDLLLAAACSAISPRAVWPNRKPDQAVEYLRSVRIGQTERGSYVLKIISRVPPKLASRQADLFQSGKDADENEDVPYERSVMNTLATGLREAESAAESAAASGTVDRFDSAVSAGVSANFCEALAGLAYDGDSRRSVDVSFTWSPTRPNRTGTVSRVLVPQDRAPFLLEAAKVLRNRSPVVESVDHAKDVTLSDDSWRAVKLADLTPKIGSRALKALANHTPEITTHGELAERHTRIGRGRKKTN